MFRILVVILGLALVHSLPMVSAAQAENQFRAGAATSNITPPLGGSIVGGFLPIPSKHVHDELHARCLVLDDGETTIALVVCDLLGIHRKISDEARRLIEERVGISPEHVLISATHTHSAVSAIGDRFEVDQKPNNYQQFVASRIADGVQRAHNLLRPAEFGFTTVDVPEHVFNRRWFMKEGTVPLNPFGEIDQVKMNPPGGSDNLVKPAGPTDPTISILSFREVDGDPISVMATYSLHYVGGVGSGHISADYFGMFCDKLTHLLDAAEQDTPFVPIMANGTSGDINNINFTKPRGRKSAYEQMRYVAHDVAEKVSQALADVQYKSEITLGAKYREPVIPTRQVSPGKLAWAQSLLEEPEPESNRADLPRIYAQRTLNMSKQPKEEPIPIQAFRIGDVSIGTMPCEIFCEIGLEYRARTPRKPGFMISLNHGYYGYLPTPKQHALGGYETWLGTNRLEVDASVILLDNLIEMTEELAGEKSSE
ncbi:MAG: neutral/alkaline non-lysosomal ceramidase N-terminal domain-containing protein [Pirellulaceae bacterium]